MIRTRRELTDALAMKNSIVAEAALACLLHHEDEWDSKDPHAVIAAAIRMLVTDPNTDSITNDKYAELLSSAFGDL